MKRVLSALVMAIAILSSQASAEVFIGGHGDIGVGFENGGLHLHFHAEDAIDTYPGGTLPAGEYEPGDIIIGVPGEGAFPGTGTARPSGSQWNFLGEESDLIWFLPASSVENKPYLGIATEELLPADGWNTPVTWTINGISTVWGEAADFSIWTLNGFGGLDQVIASTRIPTGNGNSWTQDTFSHEHFNLGFSGEGIYDVSFTVSAFNDTLNESFSDTAVFRFATGAGITAVPEPSSFLVLAGTATAVAGWRARRKKLSLTKN